VCVLGTSGNFRDVHRPLRTHAEKLLREIYMKSILTVKLLVSQESGLLKPRVWDILYSPVGADRNGNVYVRNRDTELHFLGSQE
jgi:hypothetical protein